MKNLAFGLVLIFTLGACWSTESPIPDGKTVAPEEHSNIPKVPLKTVAERLLRGFATKDFKTIREFIHPENGVYYVYREAGLYNDYINYLSVDSLFAQMEDEPNDFLPFLEFWTALNNRNFKDYMPQVSNISKQDDIACNFKKIGSFLDNTTTQYTYLTSIYESLEAQEIVFREDDASSEYNKLDKHQSKVSRRLIVGIQKGKEIYSEIFYFSNIRGKWYLTIMDFDTCEV